VVDPTTLTVSEPSGSGILTFTLTSEPVATVSVDLSTGNNQCAVSASTVDLDATNWITGVTVTVTAVDDLFADGSQGCKIVTAKARSDDPTYNNMNVRDVRVTVEDDEVPGILVVPTSITISEPSGSEIFTLTAASQLTETVSVPLTTSNGQCTVSPGLVILDPTNWTSGVTATVTAVNDMFPDGTQTCLVQTGLSTSVDPGYNGLDPDDVTVTVYDDEGPGIHVEPTSLVVSEPSGSDVFALTLTHQPTATVTVPLSASNSECDVSPGLVILDAGNWATGVEATVTAVDDFVADGTQSCLVETGNASSTDARYNGLNPADVTVVVEDDDAPGIVAVPTGLTISEPADRGILTLTLTSQPTATVSVPIAASNGQCTVSPNSVFLGETDWASGVTVTVTAVDDSIADGAQTCLVETGPSTSADPGYVGLNAEAVIVTVEDDDVAGIVVDPTELTISEPSGSDVFTLVLSSEPTATVTVPLSATNSECDVSPGLVILNAGNWATGVEATVTAVDDFVADGTQSCLVETGNASSTDAGYNGLNAADVTVIVEDDDAPGIVAVPTGLTISEPEDKGILTLTLTSQPTATVSVPIAASNGQCTVSPNPVFLGETDWASGVTVTVTAVDDSIADGAQTCLVETGPSTSADPGYVGLNAEAVIVTVEDDDVAGIVVDPTELTISEPSGSDVFTLVLTSEPTATVTVPLSATNSECDVSPGLVILGAGNWATGVEATVTAVDDFVVDGTQGCLVQTGPSRSADPNYDDRNPEDVIVAVGDDDEPGIMVNPTSLSVSEPSGSSVFTVTLTSQPTATVSIGVTVTSTECTVSPDPISVDEVDWATGVTATVRATDDSIADGAQTCLVQLEPSSSSDLDYVGLDPDDVTVTVYDDEVPGIYVEPTSLVVSEPSGSALFALKLTSQPTETVTVPLSALGGQCKVSPESVSLDEATWTTGVAAIVTAVDDAIADGSQSCLIRTELTSSGDPRYNGLNPDDVTVTVEDDDEPGILVVPTSLLVTEPSGSDVFTVTLTSQPTATVSVPLSAPGVQCGVSPGSVSLGAGNWARGVTATVTAVDDFVADGTQICLVQTGPASSADANYGGRTSDDVRVTVYDDDEPGILSEPTSLVISEPHGSSVLTVTLTSEPTAKVSVPLRALNGQCVISPNSMSLNSINWAAGVTATVTAVDDAVADGTRTCPIRMGPTTSADTNYAGRQPADVLVSVNDDDEAGISVSPTSLTVSEPDGSEIMSLTLTSEPTATVSVPLSTTNDECDVSPGMLELDATNWASGVTATVAAVDDDIEDGTQSCMVRTGFASSADPTYAGRNPTDVSVMVQDDDIVYRVFLPSIERTWPPIPDIPNLHPIVNADGNGTYSISWSAASRADDYVLVEGGDPTFADARDIYEGAATSHVVTGRGAARYYYRVKARNAWGDSEWSTVRLADVLWEAEPNDNALTQANGPLASGLTYYGTFPDQATSQDYYYFDLATRHRVRVWLQNISTGQNYDLVLRRNDAELTAVGYSGQKDNGNEYIDVSDLPAGRYYIQVFHREGTGAEQPYHLKVEYE
jgi:hypothetical protein